MSETLLTRARHNHKVAMSLWNVMGSDELYLNSIGFNLQQSVELAINFVLEQNGVTYPRTHELVQLYQLSKKENVDLLLSEYMYDHLEMFTSWEAKTRYILDFVLEKDKVQRAMREVHKYLLSVEKEYDIASYSIDTLINC